MEEKQLLRKHKHTEVSWDGQDKVLVFAAQPGSHGGVAGQWGGRAMGWQCDAFVYTLSTVAATLRRRLKREDGEMCCVLGAELEGHSKDSGLDMAHHRVTEISVLSHLYFGNGGFF